MEESVGCFLLELFADLENNLSVEVQDFASRDRCVLYDQMTQDHAVNLGGKLVPWKSLLSSKECFAFK